MWLSMECCLDVKSFGDAQKKDRRRKQEKRDKDHRRRDRNVDLSSSKINNTFPAPDLKMEYGCCWQYLLKTRKGFPFISSLIIPCTKMYYSQLLLWPVQTAETRERQIVMLILWSHIFLEYNISFPQDRKGGWHLSEGLCECHERQALTDQPWIPAAASTWMGSFVVSPDSRLNQWVKALW